jgi:protein TonB
MERHFVLPASIAAALHVGVLFGFHRVPVVHPPLEKSTYIPVVVPNLPADPPDPLDVPDTSGPKDRPVDIVPRQPETFTANPDSIPINIPITPGVDVPKGNMTAIVNPGIGAGNGANIGGILSSLNLDNPPRARVRIPPMFPTEAKNQGRTGEVDVEFIVDESGSVREPRVVKSTDSIFDEPTLRAVAKWRFEPGRAKGRIVRFRMAVPVVFNIDDAR